MDESSFIKILKTRVNNAIGLKIFFVLKEEDDSYRTYLANTDSKTVGDSLRDQFCEYLQKRIIDNPDFSIKDLSQADESSSCVYRYDYSSIPNEIKPFKYHDEILAQLKSDGTDFIFNTKHQDLNSLRGYIISLGSDKGSILLFKFYYPAMVLSTDKSIGNLYGFGPSSLLTKVDKDMIRINPKADLLMIDNELYVLNIEQLQSKTGFSKLLRRDAKLCIESLRKLNLVAEIGDLDDSLDKDNRFSRWLEKQLALISRSSPVLNSITSDKIIEFTKTNNIYKGMFQYSEDGTQFSLKTQNEIKTFIKLMSDSILKSELTGIPYEASAKSRLIKQ